MNKNKILLRKHNLLDSIFPKMLGLLRKIVEEDLVREKAENHWSSRPL